MFITRMSKLQIPDDAKDVVFLLPGFLGFEHFATLSYFADRVSAALRGHLSAVFRRNIPVVAVATRPTDELAMRQRYVLDTIARYCGGSDVRIHLVGHSTGGVDAEMLVRKRGLLQLAACTSHDLPEFRDWSEHERRVRERIRAVITIAAPHFGTTIALSPVRDIAALAPRALLQPWVLARFGYALSSTLIRRIAHALQLVAGGRHVLEFGAEVIGRHALIDQLRPDYMMQLRSEQTNPMDPALTQVEIQCIATVVSRAWTRTPDPLFTFLSNCIKEAALRPGALGGEVRRQLAENWRALQGKIPPAVITSQLMGDRARLAMLPGLFKCRGLDPGFTDNDGIVNTVCQLLPEGPRVSIGPAVVGDHADVVGHYDRPDIDGGLVSEGLFTSGSGFRDDEFFRLYAAVAEAIAGSIGKAAQSQLAASERQRFDGG